MAVIGTAPIAAILVFFSQDPNDGVRLAIYTQLGPHRWRAGKQLLGSICSQQHHAVGIGFVLLDHEPALGHPQRAECLIFRPHPAHESCRLVEFAHLRHTATQFWTNRFHEGTIRTNSAGIVDIELDLAPGDVTTRLSASPPAPDNHQIGPQILHVLFLVAAEALSQPD